MRTCQRCRIKTSEDLEGMCAGPECFKDVRIICKKCYRKLKGNIYFVCSRKCMEWGLSAAHSIFTPDHNVVMEVKALKAIYVSTKPSEELIEDLEFLYSGERGLQW